MILLDGLVRALEAPTSANSPASPCAIRAGHQQVSRAELSAMAEGLRLKMVALGVQSGDLIAWLLPNHPAFVVAHLATLATGSMGVPLNPLYTEDELVPLLRDAQPTLLVCIPLTLQKAQRVLERLATPELSPSGTPRLLVLEDPGVDPEFLKRVQAFLPHPPRAPRDNPDTQPPVVHWMTPAEGRLNPVAVTLTTPAILLYTSGTTGTPKGVVLTHGNLGHNAHWIAQTWFGGLGWEREATETPRVLAALPLCHNFGLNVTLDAALISGGTMVLLPRFSAVEALRALLDEQVTDAPLVPMMVQAILNNPELERVDGRILRQIISGGAALPGAIRERLFARFPGIVLRDTYGLSEASLVACTRPEHAEWQLPGTVGYPVGDTEVRIVRLDAEPEGAIPPSEPVHSPPQRAASPAHPSLCNPFEVGEICVRGPGVMAGYHRQPTTDVIDADGWLHTGDLGFLDPDDALTVVDRKKELIIRGGYKVSPLEVEGVLYRHPIVLEAAVCGLADGRMGEKVVAAVALQPGVTLSPLEVQGVLQSYCRQHLADFKVPTLIHVWTSLPKGSTGKILRRAVRSHWNDGHA